MGKRRSAKQRANDRRLGQMAKRRSRSAPKRKSRPRRRVFKSIKRRVNRMARRGSFRKGNRKAVIGTAIKKGAIGGASGIATELVLTKLGANGLAVDAGYVVSVLTGGKAGVMGNAVARQVVKRFGGGLGFLNGGSSNQAMATRGFA